MKFSLYFIYLFLGCIFKVFGQESFKSFSLNGFAQGTTYKIIYFAKPSDSINSHIIDSIFFRLDSSLSIYKANSLINLFNSSDSSHYCDQHLGKVIQTAKLISQQTKGVFDITIGIATLQTKFKPDFKYDNSQSLYSNCVNYNLLNSKGTCFSKSMPCVKIDVDGIAQGYSVDVIADFLISKHIYNFLIEIGGELKWQGVNLNNNRYWNIALETPSLVPWQIEQGKWVLQTSTGALTTSGIYRKELLAGGNTNSLYNARSQKKLSGKVISVTVFSDQGIIADALDNAFMAMSLVGIRKYLNKHPNVSCLIVYNKRGHMKNFISKNFPITIGK